jgi:hypothetical protein
MVVLALPSSQHFRTHDLTGERDSDVAQKRTRREIYDRRDVPRLTNAISCNQLCRVRMVACWPPMTNLQRASRTSLSRSRKQARSKVHLRSRPWTSSPQRVFKYAFLIQTLTSLTEIGSILEWRAFRFRSGACTTSFALLDPIRVHAVQPWGARVSGRQRRISGMRLDVRGDFQGSLQHSENGVLEGGHD